jgi:DNA-binding transcriptional regulator YhcF (GntR family)
MPKAAVRQTDQSVNGLFRALGVDAKTLPRTRPFYRRIVTLLEHGISRGAVAAGQQLPPERDLAIAMKISRATVVSAYRELEARGLVRGYVGRGTFVAARPDTASAPFAWRGKIAASALQASESTTVRDLVRAAWANSAPHHGFGRAMKVTKEEVIGMLRAVEAWRDAMLAALAIFLAAWWALTPYGNHGLWAALCVLYAARTATLLYYLPALVRSIPQ